MDSARAAMAASRRRRTERREAVEVNLDLAEELLALVLARVAQ